MGSDDKVARVTGTQQAVQHAGRDNELAYQEMLKGLELKRDMETILAGTNQAKNASQHRPSACQHATGKSTQVGRQAHDRPRLPCS